MTAAFSMSATTARFNRSRPLSTAASRILYEAVAFVGDRLCCIRAHIEKRVAAKVARRTGIKLAVVANG